MLCFVLVASLTGCQNERRDETIGNEEAAASTEESAGIGPQDKARWQAQWAHWEKVDAFRAYMKDMMADTVIDEQEGQDLCFTHEQWETHMRAIAAYMVEYREVEPRLVELNGTLQNLEAEAARALELLAQVECGPPG